MTEKVLGIYASNPAFKGVVPIPQDDGPHPLAQIAYSDHYAEAMSYLRALMAGRGELSERALLLTGDIIAMNPAHYTIWAYRARILFALNGDLNDELSFIEDIAEANQKNYQIYHHRQKIVEEMVKQGNANFTRELDFTQQLLDADNKNYHVWSYRQWLVKEFQLSPSLELAFTERFITKDVLNNSAWSHRYYVLFGHEAIVNEKPDDEFVDREIEYAKTEIRQLPSNAAAWNYLRGILKAVGRPLSSIESFAMEFIPNFEDTSSEKSNDSGGKGTAQPVESADSTPSEIPSVSVPAMDVIASINEKKNPELARKCLRALADQYDTMRKGYWEFQMEKLG